MSLSAEREQKPPNEGRWWFDGLDLMRKQDGLWQCLVSTDERTGEIMWHTVTADDLKAIAQGMNDSTALDASRAQAEALAEAPNMAWFDSTEYETMEIERKARAALAAYRKGPAG